MIRIVIAIVVVLATGVFNVACSGSSPAAPGTLRPIYGTVSYSVFGTAKHVTVAYRDASSALVRADATLPFFYQWSTATAGEPMSISAQIDSAGDAGAITVTILKNGAMIQEVHAAGYPNTATASGTF
jgi:hypothetical protein